MRRKRSFLPLVLLGNKKKKRGGLGTRGRRRGRGVEDEFEVTPPCLFILK